MLLQFLKCKYFFVFYDSKLRNLLSGLLVEQKNSFKCHEFCKTVMEISFYYFLTREESKKNHLTLNWECNILQWVKEKISNIKGLNAFSLTASKALLYSASFAWLKMQYFAKKSTAKRKEEDKDKPLELVECILTGLPDCTRTKMSF